MALEAILIVSFDSNSDAGAGLGGGEGLVVDPALEHTPKPTFSDHTPLPEISRRFLQFVKAKSLQIWGLQNLVLCSWTWMNRGRGAGSIRIRSYTKKKESSQN